jgi:hypothetical protein
MSEEVLPPAPVNVVAIMRDGSRIPLECRYVGIDPHDHTYVWEAIQTLPALGLRSVTVEQLPADVTLIVEGT